MWEPEYDGDDMGVAHLQDENARLRKDQEDWGRGVELIASTVGYEKRISGKLNLSCVAIHEVALERMAELERLRTHAEALATWLEDAIATGEHQKFCDGIEPPNIDHWNDALEAYRNWEKGNE